MNSSCIALACMHDSQRGCNTEILNACTVRAGVVVDRQRETGSSSGSDLDSKLFDNPTLQIVLITLICMI